MGKPQKTNNRHTRLSRAEILKVAVRAGCDPRCVVKYLRIVHDGDKDVRLVSHARVRVARALRVCGFPELVEKQEPTPPAPPPAAANGVEIAPAPKPGAITTLAPSSPSPARSSPSSPPASTSGTSPRSSR